MLCNYLHMLPDISRGAREKPGDKNQQGSSDEDCSEWRSFYAEERHA